MVITQETYDKVKKKKIKFEDTTKTNDSSIIKDFENIRAIVKSETHYGAYYIITGKDMLKCSCPSRVECKHIKDFKNGN